MLTVYSKPNCVQCAATKRALDSAGIAYDLKDVSEDGGALMTIKGRGYLQVPVVITALGDHWSGFRPGKINDIIAQHL